MPCRASFTCKEGHSKVVGYLGIGLTLKVDYIVGIPSKIMGMGSFRQGTDL